MTSVARNYDSYHVGIICALPLEKAAVKASLDAVHPTLRKRQGDKNDYTFGEIQGHNVVIACLPAGETGAAPATAVASDMKHSFAIKVGLLVGIAGAAPSRKHDIRLGDIVVSQPGDHGGVVQYDFGKHLTEGFERRGTLNKPPRELRFALSSLQSEHEEPGGNQVNTYVAMIGRKMEQEGHPYSYQDAASDILFEAKYKHVGEEGSNCEACDKAFEVKRPPRSQQPKIFYGNIASANRVMRNGIERDRIANELGALCFEMEAAGLDETFPCLVIRGICDYSDSHKHKKWQRYAAATAAAFAKEFLRFIEREEIQELEPVST